MLTYIVQAKQDYNQEKGSEKLCQKKKNRSFVTLPKKLPDMTERERGYLEGTIATAAAMSKKDEKKEGQ